MFFWIQFRIWFWIERTMIRQFWLLWRAFFLEYIFWLLGLLYTILMALNIIFGLFSSWNGRRRDRIQNLWRFLDCCKHCFSEWAKNMNSIFHPIYTLVLFLSIFFSFRPSKLILLWKRYKIITNYSFPSIKVKTQVHFFSNLSSIYPYFSIFLNMVSHLSSECEFENSYRYFLTRIFFLNNFV